MSYSSMFSRRAFALAIVFCACAFLAVPLSAAPAGSKKPELSSSIVISQVYGGSGCAIPNCSPYKSDYIELFNLGPAPVSLEGWSVQYAAATAYVWQLTPLSSITLSPGQYYLVAQGFNNNGASALPAPDATGSVFMNPTSGKIALVNGGGALSGTCPARADIVDFVGYGLVTNCFETALAPPPSVTTSIFRASNGCADTDNNSVDFSSAAPDPRNRASALNPCSSPTPTSTETPGESTPTPTGTETLTPVFTPTTTSTETLAPSSTPTSTETGTPTPSFTLTATDTVTPAPTSTETLTPSSTPTPADTGTPTLSFTLTATDTVTPTPTSTETLPPAFTPTPTHTRTPTATFTPTSSPPANLVISQVYGGGGASDAVYGHDYIEILNRGAVPVNLGGWSVQYAGVTGTIWLVTELPDVDLAPGQYFLIQELGSDTIGAPLPAPDIVGSIAMNPLAGKVALLHSTTPRSGACPTDPTLADFVGYGLFPTCFEGSAGAPRPDSTTAIFRVQDGCSDTDENSLDFILASPNPRNRASALHFCQITATPTPSPFQTATVTGSPTETPTVTSTPTGPSPAPTFTFTPTATPTFAPGFDPLTVVIDELAWSGTLASANDEWIELYNNTASQLDLTGWTLLAEDGTPAIALRGALPAHSYFLLERTDDFTVADVAADQIYTGALENAGELLTLRDPAMNVIDTANLGGGEFHAGSVSPPCSMERRDAHAPDTDANWVTNNNITRNGLDADGNEICGTPGHENSNLGPTPTPTATLAPSSTLTPAPGELYVNEFMPDPAGDWNGDGVADDDDEWIEIYNANAFAVDLAGWFLDDVEGGGSAPFTLPRETIVGPRGALAFYRADTHIALNNSNDDARLLKPDASVADAISYKSSERNASWSRVPDGANYFALYCPPTPGASNCSLAPTPTFTPTPFSARVTLNEFLPAPYKDWNHDRVLDSGDEWIELYNRSNVQVDLSGWALDDAAGGSSPYTFPDGVTILPHDFLVLYASETTLGLNNGGDAVRLLYPDASVADKVKYDPLETNLAYGRYADGDGAWRANCPPTPGAPNCSIVPPPTATRVFQLTTLAEARTLPGESRVSVLGSVIAHPCEFDAYGHEMTLSDGAAGIDVYLAYPERFSCLIPRGEQLVVTGVLRDHFGLRTLYPASNADLTRYYAPPRVLAPRSIHTGDVDEAVESMLVTIEGRVANGKNGDTLWVDDGTGMVEVYAGEGAVSFAGIPRGSRVRLSGIVHQYTKTMPAEGGYYLRARAPDDLILLERADPVPRAPGGRGVDGGAVSIAQARGARSQDYVTVGGVVTVPPGVIAPRDFWLQDGSGGIRVSIASGAGDPPPLRLFDKVSVRGRVVSSFGARELRVELPAAVSVLGPGPVVPPRPLHTGAAEASVEGSLVAIDGFVVTARGRELYIDDGTGEVLVYLDATTNIRWRAPSRGDPAHIVGVLARFGGKLEILPRFQSDITFGGIPSPAAGAPDPSFLGQLRVRGGVGEPSAYTRRLQGRAAFEFYPALTLPPAAPVSAGDSPARSALSSRAQSAITLAALLLITASVYFTAVALRRYYIRLQPRR